MLVDLVRFKMDEDSDYLDKLGVIEVLQEILPHSKIAYQALTSKESFEILTNYLVSDNHDCERSAYQLLKLLIQNYETYE